MHACMHPSMHTYIHPSIHPSIHTYIHTHTHIYIYDMLSSSGFVKGPALESLEEFEKNSQLKQIFQVLSTNQDRKGKSFVSVIEGRERPIFGVQFHPERPLFSWAPEEGINHGPHAIEVMQYFANFFLSQARMNSHQFKTKKEEDAALIYNYQAVGHSSYQCYTFRKAGKALASEAMLV